MAQAVSPKSSTSGKVFQASLMKRLLGYTKPYWPLFALALLFTLVAAVLTPLRPWLIQAVLDGPVKVKDHSLLLDQMMVLFGLLMLHTLINFATSYLTSWLGQSVIRDIRKQVFKHITGMRLRYYDKNAVGTLQTRTISDVETLNDVFSQGIVNILGDMLQVIAIVVFMFFTNVKLTLIVLSTLPMLLVSTYVFSRKVKESFQNVRKYVSQMNAFLQEHISGMLVTQIFNREKAEDEKFRTINQKHTKANLDSVLYYSIFFPVVEFILALGIGLLIWAGVGMVMADPEHAFDSEATGRVTFGMVTAFTMYINMFFRPVRMLADQFNTLQMGMVSAERIFQILDNEDHTSNDGTLESVEITKGDQPAIEFNKVWFGYNSGDWILRDVSFSVKPGEKVAIVGFTGAGKTTIISLLTRFYDFERGSMLIKGNKIEDYKLESLRKMTGLVLQDVFLFSGTILENITLNNSNISAETAKEAARLVGADKFIQQLPGGYKWEVQERGATLSAGQRQLISFARVLAYNPEILILDEATSSVDTDSEIMIQQAIETVMKGRTSIIIAHRLSTIRKADKILVMSKGQIVQAGNHDELVSQEGLYKKLYLLQFEPA